MIYTAITNHYDVLKAPEELTPDAVYVAFVDGDDYPAVPPWTLRPLMDAERNPRVLARRPKLLPHEYVGEFDRSIWVDASLLIQHDLTPLLDCDGVLGAFSHPVRPGIYAEAEAVIAAGVADPARIRQQAQAYQILGYPRRHGLFQSGFMVRRHHDPALIRAQARWFADVQTYSQRDQVSGMVALWSEGLTYTPLPGRMEDFTQYVHHPHVNTYLSGGH